MSNIKTLLGEMDIEEFEAKRKNVLAILTGDMSLEKFEISQLYTGELYRMWMSYYGNQLINDYIESFGNVDLTWEQIHTGSQLLVNGFASWLKSFE